MNEKYYYLTPHAVQWIYATLPPKSAKRLG